MGVSHKVSDSLDVAVAVKKNLAKENSEVLVELGVVKS